MGHLDGVALAAGSGREAGVTPYRDKLLAAQAAHGSALAVGLAPWPEKLPYFIVQRHDDPFLPFSKAIIDATADHACAFVFDFAAYLCLGASGAVALERAIAYVPAPLLKIVHGPFTNVAYLRALSESGFNADAFTVLTHHADEFAALVNATVQGVYLDARCTLNAAGTYSADVLRYGDDVPPLRWIVDEISFASRRDDYREAATAAAKRYHAG